MKIQSKIAGLLVVMFVVAFVGCSSNSSRSRTKGNTAGKTDTSGMSQKKVNNLAIRLDSSDFVADLTGANEVNDSVQTKAHGKAYFKVIKDSSKIVYTLKLSNADSVTMAHIHYGVPGKNGPIVVWLYPGPDYQTPSLKKSTVNGVLKTDTITSANLEGPMKGAKIKDLLHAMQHDSTYVNVHSKGQPSGFIRGQIINTSTNSSKNSNNSNQ